MNSDEINVNDQIICIQEYPEDGDQAVVQFVNYTALQTDKSADAKLYAKLIAKALNNQHKSTSGGADVAICYGNDDVEKYTVNLPCMVHACITIYL